MTWKGKSLYHLQSQQGVVCWLVLLEQGSDGHCGLELEMCVACGKGADLGEVEYTWCGGAAVTRGTSKCLICRIQL